MIKVTSGMSFDVNQSLALSRARREYLMSESDFAFLQAKAYRLTGISVSDHKREMIYSRIVRRVRALKLDSFASYCQLIDAPDSPEILPFINAITTNLTAFFRESHHFDILRETIFPDIIVNNQSSARVRIWSAGCSSGEEAYSIAMLLDDCMGEYRHWDMKVLATDLDTQMLSNARRGLYDQNAVSQIPQSYLHFFQNAGLDSFNVADRLRRYIQFNRLNLLANWPMQRKFDVIFCRNVLIYFDKHTQIKLISRFSDQLRPGGYLILGHAESVGNTVEGLVSIGRTAYQKVCE